MSQLDFSRIGEQLVYNPLSPMFFNTGLFLVLFTCFVVGYHFVRHNVMNKIVYVFLFSCYFYYKSSGWSLLILLFVIVSDFLLARQIYKSLNPRRKKQLLLLSLLVNLGLLGYFKYINLLATALFGIFNKTIEPFDVILPVGISFFIFQTLSYVIDVYRGVLKPLDNVLEYGFYVSFFPQLVAGPIVRARDFIPQIRSKSLVTNEMVGRGLFLIAAGLFKKVVISDYLSVNFVDRIFENPTLYTGFENLMGVYAYALQIYCDFSGYSDMAIGLALLLGFHFNINFDSPYRSASITEFWRRWHISLSSWLKDYLYISLGGNRHGEVRMYGALLLTMLLGGLWHGASYLFIIWGAWHGVLLVLHKLYMAYAPANLFAFDRWNIRRYISIFVTFNLVALGWIFFRADSLMTAKAVLNQIVTNFHPQIASQFFAGYQNVVLLMMLGYLLHFLPQRYEDSAVKYVTNLSVVWKALLIVLLIYVVVQVRSSELLPFIYFQF